MDKDYSNSFHTKSDEKDSNKDQISFRNLDEDEDRRSSSGTQILNTQARFTAEVWKKGCVIEKSPGFYNFMYFVVDGVFQLNASFISEDEIIRAGHFFILSCDQTAKITIVEESHLILFKFASVISPYNIPFFKDLSMKKKDHPYKFTILPISQSLTSLLKLISNGLHSNWEGYHFHLYCHGLLNIAMRQAYTSEQLLSIFYHIIDDRLEFRSRILQNYPKAHNVNELIGLMGMSKATFLKIFTEEYGMSPKMWLKENKKKFVLINLAIPDITVKDLMFRCGFHTPSNFTRFFQQHFNCTPSYAITHKEKFIPQTYFNTRDTKKKHRQAVLHLK